MCYFRLQKSHKYAMLKLVYYDQIEQSQILYDMLMVQYNLVY